MLVKLDLQTFDGVVSVRRQHRAPLRLPLGQVVDGLLVELARLWLLVIREEPIQILVPLQVWLRAIILEDVGIRVIWEGSCLSVNDLLRRVVAIIVRDLVARRFTTLLSLLGDFDSLLLEAVDFVIILDSLELVGQSLFLIFLELRVDRYTIPCIRHSCDWQVRTAAGKRRLLVFLSLH